MTERSEQFAEVTATPTISRPYFVCAEAEKPASSKSIVTSVAMSV